MNKFSFCSQKVGKFYKSSLHILKRMNSCFNTNEVLNEKDGRFDHSQSESTDSDGEIQSSNLF